MNHSVRNKQGEQVTIPNYTRSKAIRAFCTECLGWETHPSECTHETCPLYPYRGQIRLLTPEQRQGLSAASSARHAESFLHGKKAG